MKIPLSWISLYADISPLISKYAIKDLAHEYSIHTAEIDGIEEDFIDKVVVGKVLSCEKHPDSKKLSIVEVDLGEHGKTTILTGAPNISEATYVPVAMVGAVLPGDFSIGERMMAGMMSRGMICGDDEIGLSSTEATGIMILERDWSIEVLESMIGKSFFDLHIDIPGFHGKTHSPTIRNTTFEIDNKFITNRPDLFSVAGNAREFHAVFDTPFQPYSSQVQISDFSDSTSILQKTEIQTDRVLAYHLLAMDDISVSKSPLGLSIMMHRAGLTPKMDIVDITNSIMTELGQPMHAFDADKIAGHIIVRMAKPGEKLLALNGVQYTLTEEDIVIADTEKVLAIAGVIGGMESAVSESTTRIIWESGCFDGSSVRLTTQRLAIRTDASTRYEKSLDPLLASSGLTRAIEYMDFLGKSYSSSGVFEYIEVRKINHITIRCSLDQISTKVGAPISASDFENILSKLGFTFIKDTDYSIIVPSWRSTKDISLWEDISEEIGRVYGYDKVEETPLSANFRIGKKNPEITLRDRTNRYFSHKGWHEVYEYSFSNATLDKNIGYEDMDDAIHIANAFNEEYTHMRRSLASRLLLSASENLKHTSSFRFFEIGRVFHKDNEGTDNPLTEKGLQSIFTQRKQLAGVSIGSDIIALKKDIEGYLIDTIGYVLPIHEGDFHISLLHPGVSGRYEVAGETIALFGKIHPEVAHHFDLPDDTHYFEIEYEKILSLISDKETDFREIQKFPTIDRELNFIFPETTRLGSFIRDIDALHPWITEVQVLSIYEDLEKIGEGKKSVTFGFTLANQLGTINDEEALEIQNMVISSMEAKGYMLRR